MYLKSSLVILTFNEIKGLKALFDKIPFAQFDEVFTVDPGSADGTLEFLEEKGIRVILQEKRGRGEAFRIASEKAQSDILVFFSPDGNENPADTVRLRDLINQGYDLAIASRFMKESQSDQFGSFFPYRDWGNQSFTFLANLFFKGSLKDTINGFRAIRKDKFKELNLDAEGFAIEYQMSIKALKKGYKIKEIPTVEGKRIGGQSTASSIPTGLKLLKVFLKEL